MLEKMASLSGLFSGPKVDHPLADAREMRRILAEIPADNAFRALDEVVGWLESLGTTENFPPDLLFEVVRQLDEAAQVHVRRLSRDYLHSPRLSKSEEKRLWSIIAGFWTQLVQNYERCLAPLAAKDKAADALKPALPLLAVRLIAGLGALLKWNQFHYGPISPDVWSRLGNVVLSAEQAGLATKSVQIYPNQSGMTSVQQEYLKVAVFQASSMDSLLPFEIELAEKLIAHFLPGFIFGPEATPDSVYWVDLAKASPPMRLARLPQEISRSLRFFRPGSAHAEMDKLVGDLKMGGDLPANLNLGAQYHARAVLPVLQHLSCYLAPIPPQRRHDRHRVKHRMSVLNGLVNAFVVFSGDFGGRPVGLQMESWVVEDVSRGGFGAGVTNLAADWLKVGVLLALQPEGGENWLLGIVRRYHRESETEARIGIQTLSRQVVSVELKPRTASSYAAAAGVPALWLRDENEEGEVRIVMPPASFDLRESMEFDHQGRRILLTPVAMVEQTADYEVARYRPLTAE